MHPDTNPPCACPEHWQQFVDLRRAEEQVNDDDEEYEDRWT